FHQPAREPWAGARLLRRWPLPARAAMPPRPPEYLGTTRQRRAGQSRGEETCAMRTVSVPGRKALGRIAEVPPETVQPWAIVLAGGHGIRLRPLARLLSGDERPMQYVRLVGPRSLLRQTLDRVAVAIPAERTVAVGTPAHARAIAAE